LNQQRLRVLSHPSAGSNAPRHRANVPAADPIRRAVGFEFPPPLGFVNQQQRRSLARNEPTGSLQDDIENLVKVERGGQRFGGIDEKCQIANFLLELGSKGGDFSLQVRDAPGVPTGPQTV
jgi:hypothetical protein